MSEKSAAELERDAETTRAHIADTAESIRNKMSPGQLIDEFAGLFSGGDGAAALSNMKGQIRDNPLAVTMMGVGLAWLVLGKGASTAQAPDGNPASSSPDHTAGGKWESDEHREEEASAGNPLSQATASVASLASRAASAVQSEAGAVGERLERTVGVSRSAAGQATRQAGSATLELFQREPLAVAALGLAVGTAIGVMLPHTDVEDQQMGRYRDEVRGAADALVKKGIEEAKEVAAETYQSIRDEADRQGLAGDPDTPVTEKVAEVVKAGASKTEQAVRERVVMTPPREEK
jgi:ElaB/YqjD/DUF883 family membrane-anchored ribosome-binding protein